MFLNLYSNSNVYLLTWNIILVYQLCSIAILLLNNKSQPEINLAILLLNNKSQPEINWNTKMIIFMT